MELMFWQNLEWKLQNHVLKFSGLQKVHPQASVRPGVEMLKNWEWGVWKICLIMTTQHTGCKLFVCHWKLKLKPKRKFCCSFQHNLHLWSSGRHVHMNTWIEPTKVTVQDLKLHITLAARVTNKRKIQIVNRNIECKALVQPDFVCVRSNQRHPVMNHTPVKRDPVLFKQRRIDLNLFCCTKNAAQYPPDHHVTSSFR